MGSITRGDKTLVYGLAFLRNAQKRAASNLGLQTTHPERDISWSSLASPEIY
jgi:hypothetical protein